MFTILSHLVRHISWKEFERTRGGKKRTFFLSCSTWVSVVVFSCKLTLHTILGHELLYSWVVFLTSRFGWGIESHVSGSEITPEEKRQYLLRLAMRSLSTQGVSREVNVLGEAWTSTCDFVPEPNASDFSSCLISAYHRVVTLFISLKPSLAWYHQYFLHSVTPSTHPLSLLKFFSSIPLSLKNKIFLWKTNPFLTCRV